MNKIIFVNFKNDKTCFLVAVVSLLDFTQCRIIQGESLQGISCLGLLTAKSMEDSLAYINACGKT